MAQSVIMITELEKSDRDTTMETSKISKKKWRVFFLGALLVALGVFVYTYTKPRNGNQNDFIKDKDLDSMGKLGSHRSHFKKRIALDEDMSEDYFYENYHLEIDSKRWEIFDAKSDSGLAKEKKMSIEKCPNFFNQLPISFADIPLEKDNRIPIKPFLDACSAILPLFDKLGSTTFALISKDISGNIKKIHQKFTTDPDRFHTLQDMMIFEKKSHPNFKSTVTAITNILWLKRALQFISLFIDELVEKPNLSECASNAYYKTLRPYHGWMTRGFFTVAIRALPYKKDFMPHLAMSKEDYKRPDFQKQLKIDIHHIINTERKILGILQDFISENDLDTNVKI